MRRTMRLAGLGVLLLLAAPSGAADPPPDLHLALDAPGSGWSAVELVADGVRGAAARFGAPGSHINAGPCPADSLAAFTVRAHLRTRDPAFSTALMARKEGAVAFSILVGRQPGCVSFEAWSWETTRLISARRVDDGAWHEIEATYDPRSQVAALFIDGRLEAWGVLGPGGSPEAVLRLGNNIGWDQPFRGELDEVSVLRRTVRTEEMALLTPLLPATTRRAQLAGVRAAAFRSAVPETADARLWNARRSVVRAAVLDAFGLSPAPLRTPIAVEVHGALREQGLLIQRLSWASLAGCRATGWLWQPDPAPAGRRPAVLHPHGHWPDGGVDPVVQRRAARFAHAGYVSLVVDSVHVEDVASGVSSGGVMAWNNLRALDLLAAREDVDAKRIGATGASGGAQQTMVLMAIDDRLAVAAPIVMAAYLSKICDDCAAHCACNHVPRLAHLTDVPEMCAVFAPRPVFFGTVTGDWTQDFPQHGLPEVLRAYALAGRTEALESVHRDEGHNYERPFRDAVHAFFDRALGRQGPSEERAFEPLAPNRLLALGPPAALDRAALAAELVIRRPRLTSLADAAPGLPWTVHRSELRPAADPVALGGGEAWAGALMRGSDGVDVPVRLRDGAPSTSEPWVLVSPAEGASAWIIRQPSWARRVLRLAVVDARWHGEWGEHAEAWRRNGLLLGRGEGYQQAHDLALTVQSLPGEGRVTLIATGEAGVAALIAAPLARRLEALVATDLGPRFAMDGNRRPLCPEVLRFGDLPELVAAVPAPVRIAVGGARSLQGYRASGEALAVSVGPLSEAAVEAMLPAR